MRTLKSYEIPSNVRILRLPRNALGSAGSRSGFTSVKTLESIEKSRTSRLAGNHDQYRALSRRTRTLLRRDKERYVRGLAEDVEYHLIKMRMTSDLPIEL